MRTIDIFGSSTAYGYHDREKGGWAERLKLLMIGRTALRLPNAEVHNHARSSMRLGDVLKIFAVEIGNQPHFEEISRFGIFQVGSMEATHINVYNVRPAAFLGELQRLNIHCQELQVAPLFVGVPHFSGDIQMTVSGQELIFHGDQVSEYDAMVEAHAGRISAPYLNVATLFGQNADKCTMDIDRRHPNTTGHELIFRALLPILAETMNIADLSATLRLDTGSSDT